MTRPGWHPQELGFARVGRWWARGEATPRTQARCRGARAAGARLGDMVRGGEGTLLPLQGLDRGSAPSTKASPVSCCALS